MNTHIATPAGHVPEEHISDPEWFATLRSAVARVHAQLRKRRARRVERIAWIELDDQVLRDLGYIDVRREPRKVSPIAEADAWSRHAAGSNGFGFY